jgi:flagellar hook-length control protein FliK
MAINLDPNASLFAAPQAPSTAGGAAASSVRVRGADASVFTSLLNLEPSEASPRTPVEGAERTYSLTAPFAPGLLLPASAPLLLEIQSAPFTSTATPAISAGGGPLIAAPTPPTAGVVPTTPLGETGAIAQAPNPGPQTDAALAASIPGPEATAPAATAATGQAASAPIVAAVAPPIAKPSTPRASTPQTNARTGSMSPDTTLQEASSERSTTEPIKPIKTDSAPPAGAVIAPAPPGAADPGLGDGPALAPIVDAADVQAPPQQTALVDVESATSTLGAHRVAPDPRALAQTVAHRFEGKSDAFEIRLDPTELGRVKISIEVVDGAAATVTVAAERPETLSDLMRASRELERALEDAGLTLAENGLSFDLSQTRDDDQEPEREAPKNAVHIGERDATDEIKARPFGISAWSPSRIDLKI